MTGWNVQVATWTSNNRYPGIFRTVQRRIAERIGPDLGETSLKILSFGCSNGSEVSTLRSYFPEALIYACDVNPTALHSAAELLSMDEAVVFLSSPKSIAEHGPFDIIFAMSVLCRFPESVNPIITNLRPLYRFEDFEDTIKLLASNLKQNGIVCFYNTSYDFLQTVIAKRFRVVRSSLVASNGFVDRFDPDGDRITWCERVGPYYAHRLHRFEAASFDTDFTSCIFEASDKAEPDIWVPFGDSIQPRPTLPPDFVRFGPDLTYCTHRKLVATALCYWLQQSATRQTIMRAWSRTTPHGNIEHGTPWTVHSADDVKVALATHQGSLLPPAPRPIYAKQIFNAFRSANRRLRTWLAQ